MNRTDSSSAMASLAMYADEDESDSGEESVVDDNISDLDEHDEHDSKLKKKRRMRSPEIPPAKEIFAEKDDTPTPKKVSRLVSYGADEIEDDDDERNESVEIVHEEEKDNPYDVSTVAGAEFVHSANQVQIPPEPSARCSKNLQDKFTKFYEKMQRTGQNLNGSIQNRKDFRNPSIYDKLLDYLEIYDKGTNYPPGLYDPKIWGKESYYDELAKEQKKEMDKREKEKKTKVEFMTGTAKKSSSNTEEKRKSKWDTQPSAVLPSIKTVPSGIPGVVTLSATSQATKPTIISAVGTLSKPK